MATQSAAIPIDIPDSRPDSGKPQPMAVPDGTPPAHKRIRWPLIAALVLAAGAVAVLPRGFDAGWLLMSRDDPVALADRVVDKGLTPAVAAQEIAAALKAGDVDLANSFVDLAAERGIALPSELQEQVKAANST